MPRKPLPRRIEYVRLDALPPDPENVKDHAKASIRGSIVTLGFVEPIVLDERTGLIMSGHGRRNELLGLEAVYPGDDENPVEIPDGIVVDSEGFWLAPLVRGWASRDDAHARATSIALNKIGELGGWIADPLTRQLEALRDSVPSLLDVTGFTLPDIEALRAGLTVPDFSPSSGEGPRLDRKQLLVCPECGHHVDPGTAARVES